MVERLRAWPIFSAVLTAAVLAGVANTLSYWPVNIDDSYISLRYAHWLVQGEGLVYNPGEHVEGFSNPTWVALMALTLAMGSSSLFGAKVLGVFCHAFSIVAAAGLAVELVQPKHRASRIAAAAAAGLLAVSLPASFWPITGMETTFYGAMILATYWRLAVELRDPDRAPWSALIAALTAITRPEAPIVVLGAWLARAWAGRRDLKKLGVWMGIFFVPTVGYLLFRLAYYGYPLANTFYQKGHAGTLDALSLYLRPWLSIEAPIAVLGLLGAACLAAARRQRAWPALLGAAGGAFFVVWVSWDWMDNQRFIVPVLPLWVMCISAGAALLAEALSGTLRWAVVAVVGLLVVGQASQSVPLLRTDMDGAMVVKIPRTEDMVLPKALTAGWIGHGEVPVWAMEAVPPDGSIAFTDIGMLGWVADWVIVDLAGLTDEHTSGASGLDWPGRAAYLGERAPDFIILKTGGAERFESITQSAWLLEEYEIMDGPNGAIAARRKDARWATDAEILANYELATEREPHSRRFVWRRALWASAVGTPEQVQAACDLVRATPDLAERVEKCEALMAHRAPRPDTTPKPLRAGLARKLRAAPPDPAPRTADGVPAPLPAAAAGDTQPAAAAVAVLPELDRDDTPPPPADAEMPEPSAGNPFSVPGQRGVGTDWVAFPKAKTADYTSLSGGVLELRGHGEEVFSVCGPLQPVQPGDEIVLEGAWRTDSPGASVFLVVLDAAGRKLRDGRGDKFWRLATAKAPRGWGPLEASAVMPGDATEARVCADFLGEGAAALSDVRMVISPGS